MASFTIVGTGAGTEQYMIPLAVNEIARADVLIGGERNLRPWLGAEDKKFFAIKSSLGEIVELINSYYAKEKVVVLVSGDPGFYSLLNFLSKHFPRDEIKVIPGISSVQIAFAKLSLPWQDAVLLNLHGRDLSILDPFIQHPKIALLTDPVNNPGVIYDYFYLNGRNRGVIYICTKLGYPDEKIKAIKINGCRLEELETNEPTVMVITNE
ncbi:MAG: precorrin-6y C5,15-methyltransferase (decarboxylating) subunit CbiE [Peptococcaceae bacterium]